MDGPADVQFTAVVTVFIMEHLDVDIAKGLISAGAVFVADPERILVELNRLLLWFAIRRTPQAAVADRVHG